MIKELNSYNLSRVWFDYCYDNPDKVKPNHTALYFFCIEHCNRLGWKEKFGLPTTMAKEAIGIHSYNTYKKTFADLAEWGFIKVIQLSKNQYSSNIIALSNFNKAIDKALDKAFIKHDTKQELKQSESIEQSTEQSISSIIKQITNKQINKEQLNQLKKVVDAYFESNKTKGIDFEIFWNEYDKKIDKPKCISKWEKLNTETQQKILDYIPKYKLAQPDKKFRKNPEAFFNAQAWENEIIGENKQISVQKEQLKNSDGELLWWVKFKGIPEMKGFTDRNLQIYMQNNQYEDYEYKRAMTIGD